MRAARTAHIVTGLPDAYSRGRIIGDYRRIALYGIDYLIEDKKEQFNITMGDMLEDVIRDREEIQEQIRSLKELKKWPPPMVTTFPNQLRMFVKLCNGFTSAILVPLKSKTVLLCPLAVTPHS